MSTNPPEQPTSVRPLPPLPPRGGRGRTTPASAPPSFTAAAGGAPYPTSPATGGPGGPGGWGPGGPGGPGGPRGPGGPGPDGRRRGRRGIVLGVVGVLGVALAGGGALAYSAYFATGPQAAEALPASTILYVGVDLDPSGQQKLEALEMLEKFPAFDDLSDDLDISSESDLRRTFFDEAIATSGCSDLAFDDVDPWLGNRFGAAVVANDDDPNAPEAGGDAVVVLQVTDAAAASAGMEEIKECSGATSMGWAAEGGWMVVTDDAETASAVLDAAAEDPLVGDADYQRWTGAAGDAGILSMYASPAAGPVLADQLEAGGAFDPAELDGSQEAADALRTAVEDFEGAALTLRFADAGVELELAHQSQFGDAATMTDGTAGELAAGLPEGTAGVLALGLADDWYDALLDTAGGYGLSDADVDDAVEEIEGATGLDLPDDAEALLGDGIAVAVGGDVDVAGVEGADSLDDLPFGARLLGVDADEVEELVDTLLESLDAPRDERLDVAGGDDVAGVATTPGFAESLAEDGDLGGSDVFRDVVPETDDVHFLAFVDFGAGDWLEDLSHELGGQELADNTEPLAGLGLSTRVDDGDGVTRTLLRITTD